jgi:hypothetical protein
MVRFFTISDSGFFVGTVALLNSLRLTGHEEELVVLDRGLTPGQRSRLASCGVSFVPGVDDVHPWLLKPVAAAADPHGVIVLVDSDMLVTSSLEPVVQAARDGKICVFPDHPSDHDRWFAAWGDLFELGVPLRRATYANAGFLAFSADVWPNFLARWLRACEGIGTRRIERADDEPDGQLDQDALNALLMSEIPEGSVERLPSYEWNMREVELEDLRTLACAADGRPQALLHTPTSPKIWQEGGWRRVERGAYGQLMPRVLLSSDVALRLASSEVPIWLRRGVVARVVALVLRAYNRLPWLRGKIRLIRGRAVRRASGVVRGIAGATRRSD